MHLNLSTYSNALMNVDWIMHCEYLNILRISDLPISFEPLNVLSGTLCLHRSQNYARKQICLIAVSLFGKTDLEIALANVECLRQPAIPASQVLGVRLNSILPQVTKLPTGFFLD